MPDKDFERLVASLIGELLDVQVSVAHSGFQYGGDAGTVGRQGRNLRLECKRYKETTDLNEREILGEIDQALDRDPALEAWILAIPRAIQEQEAQALQKKGLEKGVPTLTLDWQSPGYPSLAALCCVDPRLVGIRVGPLAEQLVHALRPAFEMAIRQLRRDFEAWNIGFAGLRQNSHANIAALWQCPPDCVAALGQDAAGGASGKTIVRSQVQEGLDQWWAGTGQPGGPVVLLGDDGTGKTWAGLAWLTSRLEHLPIVLVMPSAAVGREGPISPTAIKQLLAEKIQELTGGLRPSSHWFQRVERLLNRPETEGPVFLLFWDGLNQAPTVNWRHWLQCLQASSLSSRIRVMTSTRDMHFQTKLDQMKFLLTPPHVIKVGDYLPEEFDRKLALEGLTADELLPDVRALAQRPRMFDLVIRLRKRLDSPGAVTRDRVLWEYGRDEQGVRAGHSFSEREWIDWLRTLARRFRSVNGAGAVSTRDLAEMTRSAELNPDEVFARLSDIVDGRYTSLDCQGLHVFDPAVVAHALGLALLDGLEGVEPEFAVIAEALQHWLDPIAGLDQSAEILRAAVSILVAQGLETNTPLAGALVTKWLQAQNVHEEHRQELIGLASRLVNPLLDTVEHSQGFGFASARTTAIQALRRLPRECGDGLDQILARSRQWMAVGFRGMYSQGSTIPGADDKRIEGFLKRLGRDTSGPLSVLGVPLTLVERQPDQLAMAVPSLLEGFPLAGAQSLFETAAVNFAACQRLPVRPELTWLCLLNQVDPLETTTALRNLGAEVLQRTPEPGIHPDMPKRVAAILLWFTGNETDDVEAADLNPSFDQDSSYQEQYLQNPSRSWFELERRHATLALERTQVVLFKRIEKTKRFWVDPSFEAPQAFLDDFRLALRDLDMSQVDSGLWRTHEDQQFVTLTMVLGRYYPLELARILLEKFNQAPKLSADGRLRRAIAASEQYLLAGPDEAKTAHEWRTGPGVGSRLLPQSRLLLMEIQEQDALQQRETILSAQLEFVSTELNLALKPMAPPVAEAFLARFGENQQSQVRNLVALLLDVPVGQSEVLWSWLSQLAHSDKEKCHGLAFSLLQRSDGPRWGMELWSAGWGWSGKADHWTNHFGSLALIQGCVGIPFTELSSRLAPWLLPYAVSIRGGDPMEAAAAVTLMARVFLGYSGPIPDPGAHLTFEHTPDGHGSCRYSMTPIDPPKESQEELATFRGTLNADAQLEHYRQTQNTVVERIRQASSDGAGLFMAELSANDLIPLLRQAKDSFLGWLEGYEACTATFQRRVLLAEGVYLALCEALLHVDPAVGCRLWSALRITLRMRHQGLARLDEIIHLLFRVPCGPEVTALRMHLLLPGVALSDQNLFEVALAANLNGCGDWLAGVIRNDLASEANWQRRRGLVLSGFTCGNEVRQPDAWPEGVLASDEACLRKRAGRRRYFEACSCHWWQQFLQADDQIAAYAAWSLFLACVDRRAWNLIAAPFPIRPDHRELDRKKEVHLKLNIQELERTMGTHEETTAKTFLGLDPPTSIGLWGGFTSVPGENRIHFPTTVATPSPTGGAAPRCH